jgi:hypothetical protein
MALTRRERPRDFARVHQTLRCTPAMEAKVVNKLWSFADMLDVLEGWESRQPRAKVGRQPGQENLESN